MKKFKGTAWVGKPNFKKIVKDRRDKKILKWMAIIGYGLLIGYILNPSKSKEQTDFLYNLIF